MLSLAAGALGLALASGMREALFQMAPNTIPLLSEVHIDRWALAFNLAAALATTVLFGLLPALSASKPEALNDRSRTRTGAGRARSVLVAAEVALSLMLVVGAGLLVKSLARLESVHPGFNPDGVLTFNLVLPRARYPKSEQIANTFFDIERRLRSGPQVTAVGSVSTLALRGQSWSSDATVEGRGGDDYERELRHKTITPDYFRAMGTPLLRGRMLTEFDERPQSAAGYGGERNARPQVFSRRGGGWEAPQVRQADGSG